MDTPLEKMGNLTPRQYGENIGGIYPFYTEQATEEGIAHESTRFIRDGQKLQSNGTRHNAILMWNPRGVQFPNNTCPYEERFDHSLEEITTTECAMLGIDFVKVVDEIISTKDGRQIEKGCHYAIND